MGSSVSSEAWCPHLEPSFQFLFSRFPFDFGMRVGCWQGGSDWYQRGIEAEGALVGIQERIPWVEKATPLVQTRDSIEHELLHQMHGYEQYQHKRADSV